MPVTAPWTIAPPKKALVVGVADMATGSVAGTELVTYSLGSCLGIAVYDPEAKVGGLLHAMLPSSAVDAEKAARSPSTFVDTGVPRLFRAVIDLGGNPKRLIVKIAGGAAMMTSRDAFSVGERSLATLEEILSRSGFTIHARDVGGLVYRTLRLSLSDGLVTIQSPGKPPYSL